MIFNYSQKVKQWFTENQHDLYITSIIFLAVLGSFGLGRLSVLWIPKKPLQVYDASGTTVPTAKSTPVLKKGASLLQAAISQSSGKFVASKSGTVYHLPWCPGALKIKEENKIWFQTKEEAENRGYRPAGNCEGL